MVPWMISLIAVTSTVLCLLLWFRDVWCIMRERKSTVESARGQLVACQERARRARGDPEAKAVLERSEKIYKQAVDIYNRTLRRPWNYLPALFMGFHYIAL